MLLRELAARGSFGWRLLDLATHCALDRATTHRLLACLVRERLVQQHPVSRRYLPGPLLFDLGLSLPGHAAFQSACAAPLARLARRMGGTALLCLRSGSDFVCAARAGAAPIKALTIDVGTRRPLMVSVGGIAILIALRKEERKRLIAENMKRVARFSTLRIKALERVIRSSTRAGYGVSEGAIVPGVTAYGIAVADADGVPFASVSVVGATESFSHHKRNKVKELLEEEAATIARLASRLRPLTAATADKDIVS